MNLRLVRQVLIPLVLIALIISAVWTYSSIKSKSSDTVVKGVTLSIIPDYQIISGKTLIAWPAGTVLPQGMASYFYAALPTVNVSPTIKIEGMEQGLLNGTIKSQIIIQSIDDKSQIYWQHMLRETPVESFTLSKGSSNQPDQLTYNSDNIALDVISAYNSITQISSELMFQNGVYQLVVNSDIKLTGTVNGIQIDRSLTQSLPLILQQVSFSVPKSQDIITDISFNDNNSSPSLKQTLIELIQNNYIQISITGSLLLLLIFLLMIGKRNKSEDEIHHKRYKEWITEGSVEVKDKLKINILNLEGLVDLAIDLDKRVIYDSKINKYYVLTEDIVYLYDPVRIHGMIDNKQQLGKLLIDKGLLKPEQLEVGLYYQNKIGSRLGESLIALGFIDESTLYSTLAAQQKIDFYELDPDKDRIDTYWTDKMSIQKAYALMSLPLGIRDDGRMVIACSETASEGIKKTLQEMFGTEIYLVASRPSSIYEALKKLDIQEKHRLNINKPENLTEEEQDQIISSYYRGKMKNELFLKSLGYLDSDTLAQIPQKESLLTWLVNKNIMTSEYVSLIKGLDRAIEDMEWKSRQEKQIPSLLDLLLKANYLTPETVEWVEQELKIQDLQVDQLLLRNYLASSETLSSAKFLIDHLQSILK